MEDPNVAFVISTCQQMKGTESPNVHVELARHPPWELHEVLHLKHGLFSEVGEVCLKDDDLSVVDALDSHKVVPKAADTVHVGTIQRSSLQPTISRE